MKKLAMAVIAMACAAAAPAFAGGDKHMANMKAMDTNGDGMISKDEFMRAHEMKWDKMKKNASGMVDMKDMEMMYGKMWQEGKAMKDKDK